MKAPELSIVATVYNDASIVPVLVNKIRQHVDTLGISYEIILVDDCSTDGSSEEIEKVCNIYENVKGLILSRNFGQQIAMSAGMKVSTGNFVIIMDGDLQNPTVAIPLLYHEILNGYDVVYTASKTRNNRFDTLTSVIFWYILTKVFGIEIVKNQLMMKIMTRAFVEKFNCYKEIVRTVTGIVRDISSNYMVISVENSPRCIGKSHYNFLKRLNLSIDLIISLSRAPFNFVIYIGFLAFCASVVLVMLQFFQTIQLFPDGFAFIGSFLFFFCSLIVLLLGVIGRYLACIYLEVRSRPLFQVKKYYNFR